MIKNNMQAEVSRKQLARQARELGYLFTRLRQPQNISTCTAYYWPDEIIFHTPNILISVGGGGGFANEHSRQTFVDGSIFCENRRICTSWVKDF